jgi:hypothetical protein
LLLCIPARTVELREIVFGHLVGIQQGRGDNEDLNTKAWLLDAGATFPNHQEFGKRVVGLLVDRTGFHGFEPFDNVIARPQTLSPAKVRFSLRREPAYAIDATLLEHHHLCPGAHQAIGEQDVTREKVIDYRLELAPSGECW